MLGSIYSFVLKKQKKKKKRKKKNTLAWFAVCSENLCQNSQNIQVVYLVKIMYNRHLPEYLSGIGMPLSLDKFLL